MIIKNFVAILKNFIWIICKIIWKKKKKKLNIFNYNNIYLNYLNK